MRSSIHCVYSPQSSTGNHPLLHIIGCYQDNSTFMKTVIVDSTEKYKDVRNVYTALYIDCYTILKPIYLYFLNIREAV